MIRVRREETRDRARIYEIVTAAFGREGEAKLVDTLRNTTPLDHFISIVAEVDGVLEGHTLFSPISIEQTPALALAPVAVTPGAQNKGLGTAMIRAGLELCREAGHKIVVVVGHPTYYPRFGFSSARAKGLEAPFPVSDEAFMVLELEPQALKGHHSMVHYPRAFLEV